jgi:hypothetical protein
MPEDGAEIANTKGVIRIFISKKNWQHNDQKYKATINEYAPLLKPQSKY